MPAKIAELRRAFALIGAARTINKGGVGRSPPKRVEGGSPVRASEILSQQTPKLASMGHGPKEPLEFSNAKIVAHPIFTVDQPDWAHWVVHVGRVRPCVDGRGVIRTSVIVGSRRHVADRIIGAPFG